MTSATHEFAADSGAGETSYGPHETLARRFIAAIEQRDADAYAALFAEDAVAQHPLVPDPIRGREQIRASEQALVRRVQRRSYRAAVAAQQPGQLRV